MARNIERDLREEQRRRQRILTAGLKLFSEKGIENVSLQAVADEAEVGVATLYNYYQNKTKLVVAISAMMWTKFWEISVKDVDEERFKNFTAYESIELYTDIIIKLYREHPEILKFSSDYKTYLCRQSTTKEEVQDHINALNPMSKYFHILYERAKEDKSIRTDIPEDEMFTSVTITVLAMAERYASGLVWSMSDDKNYTKELYNLKEMILNWVRLGI